ncbi:MAG: phosphotransferase [Ktedonobacteraceae bacterium]
MTPHELTMLLYQAGALQQGSVIEIQTTKNEAFNSHVQHLKVSYSPNAIPQLPAELVLKKNVPTDWGREAGRSEVAFYRFIAQYAQRFPMIIPHVVATYDEQTGDSLLLLQDLSATHHPPITRQQQIQHEGMPAETTLHQIVATLATFHAVWWEHPQLGTSPLELDADFQDEEHFRDYCLEIDQNWQSCLAAEGNWLPQDVVYDIGEMTRLLPGIWERYLAKRFPTRHQLTFLHTDAYLANFLVPRTDEAGIVYMMDWQLPYIGIGAFDLVIMCASFWTSAQRQENEREETMLRLYLATLHAHGVTNYTWDQLLEDYRLMIIIFLQMAIWDQTNGSSRDYWWPKLQCLLSAARDLDCRSLLL